MKPHLKLVDNEPVPAPRPASSAVEKARQRFGADRKFVHEHGSNFQRYPEPVLTRYFRKAEWRNVKHKDSK